VVGVKSKLDKSKLKIGSRVTLDMTTLTIMRVLPREVDPMVYNMLNEDPGKISFRLDLYNNITLILSYILS
jgi:26S proteasome regulatory subunit T4